MKNFKRVLALVLSVLLILGTIAVVFAADVTTSESEDNNSINTATAISSPTGGAAGSLSSADDVDYFSFTQKATGFIQFEFTHDIKDGEDKNYFDVEVLKAGESSIVKLTATGTNTTTKSSTVSLAEGQYYIKVSCPEGYNYATNNYTVKAVSVSSTTDTEIESNDDVYSANSVAINKRYMGTIDASDVDYYSFTVSKGYISILLLNGSEILSGSNDSNFKVTIWQFEKKTTPSLNKICTIEIDENDTATANDKKTHHYIQSPYIGVDAGTYYIEVIGTNGATGTYGIEVYSKKNENIESEYNNSKDYADKINNGAYLLGSTSASDDVDFFKITTTSSESSTIKVEKALSSQTLTGSWTVELLDSKGDRLDSKTVTDKTAVEFSLADKKAGTYYIEIISSGDNGALYKISATKVDPKKDSSSSSSSGNSWDNLWATIGKMDWGSWWNKNFSFLSKIDWQTTITQLLKGSFGTIIKYFLSNLTK